MRTFGLIGYPLGHSFSASYFSEKFSRENILDASFKLFPLKSISEFPDLIRNNSLNGLSVTIPYKQSIISYLDEIDAEAETIGAVNCIKFVKISGKTKLIGYNTDIYGFETLLKKYVLSSQEKALILGSGGGSKAIASVLRKIPIAFKFVSRTPYLIDSLHYNELTKEIIKKHRIIINTTPVGMFPDINKAPQIPYNFISENHLCIDIIYNPLKTSFLIQSELNRAKISNGIAMLYAQAERSWTIWNK